MDRKYLFSPDFIIVFPDFVDAGDIQKILFVNRKCWQMIRIQQCLGKLQSQTWTLDDAQFWLITLVVLKGRRQKEANSNQRPFSLLTGILDNRKNHFKITFSGFPLVSTTHRFFKCRIGCKNMFLIIIQPLVVSISQFQTIFSCNNENHNEKAVLFIISRKQECAVDKARRFEWLNCPQPPFSGIAIVVSGFPPKSCLMN